MNLLSINHTQGPLHLSKHYHDCHQLLYVVSGRILFRTGEEERIAESGMLLLLSRLEEHSIVPLSREYERYTLRIAPELSDNGPDRISFATLLTRAKSIGNTLQLQEASEEVEAILAHMLSESRQKASLYEEMLELDLQRLLILIYRLFPSLFTAERGRGPSLVGEIQRYLEECYEKPVTLLGLSRDYHVSASHLSHQFKSITGYAPMEYLQACRLSRAKKELAQGTKSVREIVDLCGFGDESNFCRTFRRRLGMTPSQFRRQYRDAHQSSESK